ncbi:MAG: TonB-dependent receptor plug domain-containing protein [Anaeromyxobacteraceae bacterium]
MRRLALLRPSDVAALSLAALAALAARPVAAADAEEPAAAPAAAALPAMGEEIVVTGTRLPRSVRNSAEAVTVLPRSEIDRSPTKTVDELLRQVPSFGLFRRTSSVVADPSAQGVNLRGLGPSGVSRSLVLVDGIPANDPFGGWVYWRAIPRTGIDHVEVVPGGASALYGNYALGGVTQVISRPLTRSVDASTECGTSESCLVGARAANTWGPVGASIEGDFLHSRGYEVVAPSSRGAIDGLTPSDHGSVNGRVEARATPDLAFTLRGGWFNEDENGGTRFTTAGATTYTYAASARYTPERVGALDVSVYGHKGEFRQNRAALNSSGPPRSSETLGATQVVPTHDLGTAVLWTNAPLEAAGTHTLMVGIDARRITGDTHEDLFTGPTSMRDAKGEQRLYGVFAQDVYDVSEAVSATAALRYDRWENLNASRLELSKTAAPAFTAFADHAEGAFSPKLGLRVRPLEWLTLRASAYRSFRAPTLNELYRPFQVGTIRTLSNENLNAETLDGAEAGVELSSAHGLRTRVTGFWNVLHDPVSNVTCPAASAGAPCASPTRQRQNLGDARIRGVETELGWRFARPFIVTVGYTFVESRITSAPGQDALVGKELPQDPRHRASASLAFDDPRLFTAAAQVRYVSRQFEDDLNTSPMAGMTLVDISLQRRVAPDVELVFAIENLFDTQYLVGRAGIDTVGQPRFVHGGLRMHFGG